MTIKIIPHFHSFVHGWIKEAKERFDQDAWDLVGILDYKPFNDALALEVDQCVVGVTTLSSGAIVGVYIIPTHRKQGHGMSLLKAAVDRCRQREAVVLVEVCDTRALRLIEKLASSPEYRGVLDVQDVRRDE